MTDQVKTCSKCGETKRLAFFHKSKVGKYGVKSACKKCAKEINAAYREKNPEKVRESCKRYKNGNPDKVRESHKRYHKENRDKEMEYQRKWRQKNPDKVRQQSKRRYEKNPDKAREKSKKYREKNLEKCIEKNKRYRDELADLYVICQIKQGSGLTASEIPQELIELKRVQLQITRELRESKK
jgi:hypothetical protein